MLMFHCWDPSDGSLLSLNAWLLMTELVVGIWDLSAISTFPTQERQVGQLRKHVWVAGMQDKFPDSTLPTIKSLH